MKARLCFTLLCCILLGTLIFPANADDTPVLIPIQSESAEPGQDIQLTLSLPAIVLAGGFINVQYDAALFSCKQVQLLQATDALTLTYHDKGGSINLLLDAAQNVQLEGAFLCLTFASSEEAQPGTYPVNCTVPDAASFYALAEDGSTTPLQVGGCQGQLTLTSPVLPTAPASYLACQETAPKDGNISVRLCALVAPDAVLSRGSYGFICSVTDTDGTRELTLGGSEITDMIEGGGKTYTASELGGSIYTATLSVCATGTVSITVTPYVCLNGQTLYAGTYTISYQDGVYTATST